MQVYASIDDVRMPLAGVPAHARRAEELGFDGLIVPEAVGDAMLMSLLALEHTTRLRVITGVVVAFARSPMILAQEAWGLAQLSHGRFELGLGPQVKGNVVGRFGMPWSAPAPRMRDYVGALRAIFECWQTGGELDYQSESYTLNRMQPFFRPEPLESGPIRIALGAVGPRMTQVAGQVADTLITHPTNASAGYLRDVVRPALSDAGSESGRSADAVHLIANPMTATGPDQAAVEAERGEARQVLSFTYSTPAYRGTLDYHGWGDVHEELLRRTRAGEWQGMDALITDEILDALVPTGVFGQIASVLRDRYADCADGICLRMPRTRVHDLVFARVIAEIQSR